MGKEVHTISQFNKIPKPIKHNRSDIPETPTESNHLINLDNGSNIKNALDIIFDQARNIQILQEKVMSLQSELEKVVLRLRITNDDKSMNCTSCSGRRNAKSVGTNTTSLEAHRTVIEHNDYEEAEPSMTKLSKKSSSMSQHRPKDRRSDNNFDDFLFENSINFPRQFLGIHSNHCDTENFDNIPDNTLFSPSNQHGNIIDLTQHPSDQTSKVIINMTPKNIDVTDISIEPLSGRNFLKVPSMYKTNTSSCLYEKTTDVRRSQHLNVIC
jgi:hypothetical protein